MTRCLRCHAFITRGSRCAACTHERQREKNAQLGGSGFVWQRISERIQARDGGCVLVGEHGGSLTVDHIVPRADGGTNDDANLRTLCKRHHDAVTAAYARARSERR